MLRYVLFFCLIAITSSLYSELTPKELGAYLKSYNEEGYRFVREGEASSWYVSFKLDDWKMAWPVLIQIAKGKNEANFLVIGTTIKTLPGSVPPSVLTYLMKRNGDDNNIGALSVYESDKTYIQYFVKIPLEFTSLEQVIYSLGWVAAYANSLQDKLTGMLSPQ